MDQGTSSGKSYDMNFHPYIDMMVNDFDERTLDEEEALEVSEDPQTELSNYKEEVEMLLDELLAMCGYGNPSADKASSINSDESQPNHEWTTEKDESETCSHIEEPKSEPSHLHNLYADLPSSPKRKEDHGAWRLIPFSGHLSYEDDGYDHTPYKKDEWKQNIRIGSEYQATIPDGLCKYDDPLPYENEDILLWDPKSLEENELEKFLVKAQEPLVNNSQLMSYILPSTPVRDEEQALYLLQQCRYSVEEAFRKRRMDVAHPTNTMNLWSEDECRNFENGFRKYGKDFRMIQQNNVQTRSVGELVQFYYRCKKTERLDIFASKFRPEKKEYTLHPGVRCKQDMWENLFCSTTDIRKRRDMISLPANLDQKKRNTISTQESGKSDDKNFHPYIDFMFNDIDDERTLDEEEALEVTEDPQTELSNYKEEVEMLLDELLAMCGYCNPSADKSSSISSDESQPNHEWTTEKDESETCSHIEEPNSEPSHLHNLYADLPSSPKRKEDHGAWRLTPFSGHLSYEDDGYDHTPYKKDEWKQTIRIGSEYQATIPDGLCKYDDPLPYENEDILLWDPKSLEENELEKFLVKAQEPLVNNSQLMSYILPSTPVRDEEQALYLLQQCRYSVEEALRRHHMDVAHLTNTLNLWSEDECKNFENGLRKYRKDFRMIQQNKVQTRSVGELVQFYYRWKKTERHDIFASKFRPEKKKYTLHLAVSDYTDRFFNEEDSPGYSRDTSSSLNTHSLFSGYPKRQQRVQVSTADALNNMASTRNILETGKLADVEVKDSGNVEAHAFDAGDAAISNIVSPKRVATGGDQEGKVETMPTQP